MPYGIVAANDPVNKIDPSGKSTDTLINATVTLLLTFLIANMANTLRFLRPNNQSGGNIVYRGLGNTWRDHFLLIKLIGIHAKGMHEYSASDHIESEQSDTIWISTARHFHRAAMYASTGSGYVASIDLNKIEKSRIFDTQYSPNYDSLSSAAKFNADLEGKEVLIKGWVNPRAITSVIKN